MQPSGKRDVLTEVLADAPRPPYTVVMPPRSIVEALALAERDPGPMRRFVGLLMGLGSLAVGFASFAALHWQFSAPTLTALESSSVLATSGAGALWLATAFWRSRIALWIQIAINAAWSVIIALNSAKGDLTAVLFLLATFVLLAEYVGFRKAIAYGVPILSLLFAAALVISLRMQTRAWLLAGLSAIIVSAVMLTVYGAIVYKHWLLQQKEKELLESRARERTREMESALDERKTMLREMHHRMNNDLQIIASLLRLETGEITDPAALQSMDRSLRRISAMALVHETLYQAKALHRVDLGDYVRELIQVVSGTLDSPVELSVEIGRTVEIGPDFAVPFGLLVSEIIAASLQALALFAEGGSVRLSLDCGDIIGLTVADSGPGFGDDFDLSMAKGLGLTIIRSLAEQLQGEVVVEREGGARWVVTVPYPTVEVSMTENSASR